MSAVHEQLRQQAYSVFHAALRRGDVVKPSVCSECGAEPEAFLLRAHHADHALPLDVEWLCSKCHGTRNLESYLRMQFGPAEWSILVLKCKRDGLSVRAAILTLLREWVKA